jgi:hypothetical protein
MYTGSGMMENGTKKPQTRNGGVVRAKMPGKKYRNKVIL